MHAHTNIHTRTQFWMTSKKDTRTERNAEIGAFSMNLWANHFHDEQIYFKNVEQYTRYTRSGTEQN